MAAGLLQLIIVIDEAMEGKPPIIRERADTLLHDAKLLLQGGEKAGTFATRYAALIQRVPPIATANAELSKNFAPAS